MASDVATVSLAGTAFVILPAAEYERLRAGSRRAAHSANEGAGEGPPLPEPDDRGRFPAIAYSRASLARKIIRRRQALGIGQAELARLAGVRVETLNRIEKAHTTPSIATVDKIDRALHQKEAEATQPPAAEGKAKVLLKRPKRPGQKRK
jgi:DNA-binding XRE family transcriptional regulator